MRAVKPSEKHGTSCWNAQEIPRIEDIPARFTQTVSETIRAAANESQLRKEVSDLRVSSEVTLKGLQDQLHGISEQQKRLRKSLRARPTQPSTVKTLRPDTNREPAQFPDSLPVSILSEADAKAGLPVAGVEVAPAITVVSNEPLKIDVRTRSTTIAELLSEFARATGSDLVMASEQDHRIQAISLSSIEPHVLFDLLDQNQPFEILFEGNRVSLQSRPQVADVESTGASVTTLDEAEAALEASSPAASKPAETTEPADPPKTEVAERLTPLIDETEIPTTPSRQPSTPSEVQSLPESPAPTRAERRSPGITETKKLQPETHAPLAVTSPNHPATSPDEADFLKPLAPPPAASIDPPATPIAKTPEPLNVESLPSVKVALPPGPLASRPDLEPAPAPRNPTARQRRQKYRLFATVMHITLTNTQAVEPEGVFPVRLHSSRRPGHASAVRQVLDQAGRIGRVTPVTEASVNLDEGQAARLKIGSQCLHCNTEYGVEAGDTLRVAVHLSPSGQPRLRVQGLAAGSGEALATLDSFEAAVPASQSFLVSEEGTAGYVDVEDKSSKLTKLPLIGHRFEKSNRVRQIAQRFIVLTLRPAGYTEVAQAPAHRPIQPASRNEQPRFENGGSSPREVYAEKLRAVSRSLAESERAAALAAPAPRPIQFTLPSLPVPAMPVFEPGADNDVPSVPPADEMPIRESEAVGLIQAPPAEDEEIYPVVSHEVPAARRTSTAPRLIDQRAVDAARAAVSPPRAATPTTRVVEIPQIPTFQRKRPHQEAKPRGVRQATHSHKSNDDCPECRKLYHRDPEMRKLVPAPSRLVRRLPNKPARPRTRESLKSRFARFRDGLDLPVPDDL